MRSGFTNSAVHRSRALYAVVDFSSMDRHTPWSYDAQFDLASSNVDHIVTASVAGIVCVGHFPEAGLSPSSSTIRIT